MFNNLGQKINFYSIKSKLTVCFLLLSILPISIFAFFSYQYYIQSLHRNINLYTNEVIERIDKNIETYISDIENVLELRNDYYMLQYLKLNEAGDIDGNRKYTMRIWETFNSFKKIKTSLEDIRLISHTGKTISCYGIYGTDTDKDFFYNQLLNESNDEVSIEPPWLNMLGKKVFSIGKVINTGTLGGLGAMYIDINIEFLDRICNDVKLGEKGYVYLIDENGQVIYFPSNLEDKEYPEVMVSNPESFRAQNGSFVTRLKDVNYIVTYKTSTITGWKIVGIAPEAEMTKDIKRVNQISLAVIIISIFIVSLLTIYLTNILTNPIRELRGLMQQASENDLSIHAEITPRDEIGQLGQSFNKMINKIRDLIEKQKKDQLKIREMETKALQELIKPHFIYNTLDGIIGLLEQKRNDDAMLLVESLGKFFRISLSHGKEIISIKEELSHIRSYLLIQQFRFSNKFDYLFEIEEALYQYKTIKLILQPLVENAIYHGIRGTEKKGLIIIKGYIRQEQIFFEIIDNGRGMEEDVLSYMNDLLAMKEEVSDENDYFGVRNVNGRIKLTFGNDYGLWYVSRLSMGTKAIISIPLMGLHDS